MSGPPETINCIECGGVAHRLTFLPPDEQLEDGYPVAYRCSDCMDRFDVVWESGDQED